nr:uncharacterized protein LOC128698928 isoform X2 [Cherax quadricarinatus]
MMKIVPMTQVVLARLLVLTFLLSRTTQQGSTNTVYNFRDNVVFETWFPETGGVQGWVWPQENDLQLKLTFVYAMKTEKDPVFYLDLTHALPGRWWQIALFRENERTALLLVQGRLSYRLSVNMKNVARVNLGSKQKGFLTYGPTIQLSTVCSLNATTEVTSGTAVESTNYATAMTAKKPKVVPTNIPTVEPINITPAVPTGVPTNPSVITYPEGTIIPPDGKDIKMRGIQEEYQDVQGPGTSTSEQYHKYYIPVNNIINDQLYDYVPN